MGRIEISSDLHPSVHGYRGRKCCGIQCGLDINRLGLQANQSPADRMSRSHFPPEVKTKQTGSIRYHVLRGIASGTGMGFNGASLVILGNGSMVGRAAARSGGLSGFRRRCMFMGYYLAELRLLMR